MYIQNNIIQVDFWKANDIITYDFWFLSGCYRLPRLQSILRLEMWKPSFSWQFLHHTIHTTYQTNIIKLRCRSSHFYDMFPVPWCSELRGIGALHRGRCDSFQLVDLDRLALGPFVHYISSLLPSEFNTFLGVTESRGVTCHFNGFGQIYWIYLKIYSVYIK